MHHAGTTLAVAGAAGERRRVGGAGLGGPAGTGSAAWLAPRERARRHGLSARDDTG